MKDLYRLKKSEYNEGSEKTLLNSEKHYEASLLLAQNGLYPFAISHIILSAEELTKAIVLKLKSIDNSVTIPDFDKYFKSHIVKHSRFFKISELVNELLSNSKKEKKDNGALLLLGLLGLLVAITFLFDKMNEDKNKTQLELENAKKDAIDSIEKIRLASTYVELLHSRTWRAPFEQYKKEFYEGANELYKQIVPKIKNFVFIGKLTSEEIQDFVDKFSVIDK